MIDRPDGVDLALCEKIAGRLNAALRERDDLYTLQVESAGLDRPLVHEHDFERFCRAADLHQGRMSFSTCQNASWKTRRSA